MKVPIPSFRKIRSIIVLFLTMNFFIIVLVKSALAYNIGDPYTEALPSGCNLQPPLVVVYVQPETYYTVRYFDCEHHPYGCPQYPPDPCGIDYTYREDDQHNGNFVIYYTAVYYAHSCNAVSTNLTINCGGSELVDWTNWNEETCTGGKCKDKEINNLQFGPPPDNCSPQ